MSITWYIFFRGFLLQESSIQSFNFDHCLLFLSVLFFEMTQHQQVSSPSAQPNYYLVVHILEKFAIIHTTASFLCIMFDWYDIFQFFPMNLIFPIFPMVTSYFQLALYFVFFFFFFFLKSVFCLRFWIAHVFQVPFTSNISQQFPVFPF